VNLGPRYLECDWYCEKCNKDKGRYITDASVSEVRSNRIGESWSSDRTMPSPSIIYDATCTLLLRSVL
jgi:hypothetical protein